MTQVAMVGTTLYTLYVLKWLFLPLPPGRETGFGLLSWRMRGSLPEALTGRSPHGNKVQILPAMCICFQRFIHSRSQ